VDTPPLQRLNFDELQFLTAHDCHVTYFCKNTAPLAAILKAVQEGHDVNEVEAAGNTPLHFACYEGWLEG